MMISDVGWEGMMGSDCSGRPVFIFLLKKIGFAPLPDIVLSQTLMCYWQEIFLLTLVSDNDAILQWYYCIVYGWNAWSIWMWCDLVLLIFLISFVHRTVRLLFYSLLKRGGGGRGGGGWKLDNFTISILRKHIE